MEGPGKTYNKIIFAEETLIDLTADTITPEDLQKGVTAHDKSGASIVGTCEKDVVSTDATATAEDILSGLTAYANGQKLEGTMPNNEAVTGSISNAEKPYQVPIGYHNGSGTVGIDETEKGKLIADNIKEGITVLGITGTHSGLADVKAQEKTVTPTKDQQIVTPEGPDYNYLSQVTVNAIPYHEEENDAGGTTVTIG